MVKTKISRMSSPISRAQEDFISFSCNPFIIFTIIIRKSYAEEKKMNVKEKNPWEGEFTLRIDS